MEGACKDLTGSFYESCRLSQKEISMKYWISYEGREYVIRDDDDRELYRNISRASVEQFYQKLIAD